MRTLVLATIFFAAAAATAACASVGEPMPRDRNLLTAAEIETSDLSNAYEIVRGLRPTWLRMRGPNSIHHRNPVSVYLDDARMGGPEALSSIPRLNIQEIRFLSGPEAQSRFGLNNTNGAIVVRTRSG